MQMDSLKPEEVNEILQKGSFSGSDQSLNLGKQNLSLKARNSDAGSHIDPISQYILEPHQSTDPLQKEKIKLTKQLQAQMEKCQKIAGDIEGSQTTVNIIKDTGTVGVQTLEFDTIKNKSAEQAEQQEMNPAALDLLKERNFQKECPLECSNLQEGNYVMQQQSESLENESYNYLIEKDNSRNQLAYKSDSMEEEMTLQQEVQAKPELVQDLKKQIEILQLALQESQCQNASLVRKQEKWSEERDRINKSSGASEAELAHTKKENQKLRKQISAKATELKNLQIMFSSLGKEKEVMTAELALKARILADMEEHLNDLKEQNKTLSNKLLSFAREQKSKTTQMQGTITLLQNRDKLLAEQLLKSTEACRTLKRKLKELQEHNSILKKDTANLNLAIQKQEKSIRIVDSERRALRNELSWGKEQLHILQEKCKYFKDKTESVTKQDPTKPNKQRSFIGEIALLEQMLVHFKEEITCLKAESSRRDKECQDLKEEVAKLQTELSYLYKENSLLKRGRTGNEIGKKLNGGNLQSENLVLKNKISSVDEQIINMGNACSQLSNTIKEVAHDKAKGTLFMNNCLQKLKQNNQFLGVEIQSMCKEYGGAKKRITSNDRQLSLLQDRSSKSEDQESLRETSIRSMKSTSDMQFCNQAEVSHSKDITIQISNKSCVSQNLEDGLSFIEQGKKVLGSQINSLANKVIQVYRSLNDLQMLRPNLSEDLLLGHETVRGLEMTVKELGIVSEDVQNERLISETYDQELCKQLMVSEQLLKEIEKQIFRLAYERNGHVIEVPKKAASIPEVESQEVSL
ncbi:hypothetical protein SUGI_0178790 [Cryptomeria japonica]|uniref:uncharacterized protein LOC131052336 n=1 Tax=Cryptomeria japonica TaxID=3369 RepID=UPI002408E655|nr:uncharacterized protein LOC131052336 [Cryptomeria japonica]XP_057842959.2 uncharacterized protein LOC131052336 [Cryptomeria japonica]GLJ11864.1 hypothetical protein SUGI_0178790 [Cryptomeria japonica]